MLAFHNNAAIKSRYLDRVRAHAAADEIQKGFYWQRGRGNAVGCTIHGSDHAAYETEMGIPMWLALLEDRIFAGLPLEEAKRWPERFLAAITVGQDLEAVKAPFLAFAVSDSEESARAAEARAEVLEDAAARAEADVMGAARTAEGAAWSAARTAEAAAWFAAEAARAAAAEEAEATWSAARAAAWSTAATAEAWSVSRAAVWSRFAEKLIALIELGGNAG
jgi:hypothetical protein